MDTSLQHGVLLSIHHPSKTAQGYYELHKERVESHTIK